MHSRSSQARPERRSDLDWLRILAVLLLIPFHTARVFDTFDPFYAKNRELSPMLSYGVIAVLNQWHMPLLFLLAGAATWFALGFRSNGAYIKERFTRLLVPFIFGVLVVVPPQAYFALRTNGPDGGSLLRFYTHFFGADLTDLSGYRGTFTPGHLWFILFLFIFSIVALPLFRLLTVGVGQHIITRVAEACERPGVILLLALPLPLTSLLPDLGGKNPFWYLTFFVYGYVLMTDTRFQRSIDHHTGIALVLGMITMGIVLAVFAAQVRLTDAMATLFHLLCQFNTWLWLVALLGMGHRYLARPTPWLSYANEVAYPFYILHQTVIVAIAFYVVRWDVSIAAKFLLIGGATAVVTLLMYEIAVKRNNLTRFLFGMKPMHRSWSNERPIPSPGDRFSQMNSKRSAGA